LTRNSAEAFWGDEYNLSDTGAYGVNLDVGVATKVRKWLSWNLALSDRYLSNPVPGRKPTDWLYTTGLGVTFAR
jgi:hypothetical protein